MYGVDLRATSDGLLRSSWINPSKTSIEWEHFPNELRCNLFEAALEEEEAIRIDDVDETNRMTLCDAYTPRAATVWTISGIKVPVCSLRPRGSGTECEEDDGSPALHVHRRVYGFDGTVNASRADPARTECGHGRESDLNDSEESIMVSTALACDFPLPICW